MAERQQEAEVLVVGAGPAGSAAATHLARAGVDVLVLEKGSFPREKVCGDGLTPRGVRQLLRLGVDIGGEGWKRTRGVRAVCGGREAVVDWPALGRYPDFGLTRTRHDFDDLLARHAEAAGARLRTGTRVTGPVTDRTGRIVGVTAAGEDGAAPVTYRAPVVIAADGASARTAVGVGRHRDPRRPVATAARRYYLSPALAQDDYLRFWADLRFPGTRDALPGYGWIFPLADGRVNVGVYALPHRSHGPVDLRASFGAWLADLPEQWGLDDGSAGSPLRSAALPMGLNRHPQYARGLLLVGDSAGMVSPWSGEGIAQAMESGEIAADTVALALTRPAGPRREQALRHYPAEVARRWGGHYRLAGAVADHVVRRLGYRPLMNRSTLSSPAVLGLMTRLMAHLVEEPAQDAMDHVLHTALRLVPRGRPRGR